MTIFYGLGNHDSKYLETKHNAGRLVLENLAELFSLKFAKTGDFFLAKNNDIFLLYSAGFMNNSGEVLQSFFNYFKNLTFTVNDTLVFLQDDSDQIEGNQKLSLAGGSAGHHGINSLYKHLLNLKIPVEDVLRLKIGIRPPENKLKSETFVLSRISETEKKNYNLLAKNIFGNIELFRERDLGKLQTILNTSLTL